LSVRIARWRWPLVLLLAALTWIAIVHLGLTAAGDHYGLLQLRSIAEHSPNWVTNGFLALTWIGDADQRTPIILLAAIGLFSYGHRRAALALPVAAYGSTLTANGLLKPLLARARPDVLPWWSPADGYSLPSGHATGATAFVLIGWLLTERMSSSIRTGLRGFAVLLATGIGLSRPWLGVHWPSDIIAGWLWGGAFAVTALVWTSRLTAGLARVGTGQAQS
jgi:undecaprenyl-diphosphatase